MITVRMEQHPVGQGGLSTGEVTQFGHSLRWAYDCGSTQDEPLVREIKRAARGGGRDLLFLSHLDSDHVSGVDRLLAQCPAREVVLPYMEHDDLLATATRDAARGRLSGLYREASSDLAGWFAARGVETLTFVRGAPDGDEGGGGGDGPIVPEPSEGGRERGEGEITAKWTVTPSPLDPRAEATLAPSIPPIRVQQVPREAALKLESGGAALNWVLIPHVHRPESWRFARFRNLLEIEFGLPLDVARIANAARSEVGRNRLRSCYDGLWADHNLVSMTLYSGPLSDSLESPRALLGYRYFGRPGLMLTGDAHLDQRGRRKAFFRHYRRFSPLVGGLMLPHHGSIHNFHEDLLDGFPRLEIAFACAGPNNYGHPHSGVRHAVKDAGLTYRRVSHKRRRAVVIEFAWES
jgi:hypothetical protein